MELNKIYTGDCLEILKTLPNNSVDCVITDPPYNISVKGKIISRKLPSYAGHKKSSDIKLDFGDWDIFESKDKFFSFTASWFSEVVRILKDKSWLYIFFDKQKTGYFDLILAPKLGIKSKTIFTWLKSNPTPSFRKVNWLSASEFIWVGSKGECKLKNFSQQKDMFNYMITPNKSSYGETEHPTEKPVQLLSRFIEASTLVGDVVLNPFIGSGTTAVACKRLGRKYIGIEINPEYVEIAKRRLSSIPEPMF